ncbi:MAG: HAD family hydrolase [Acidobacteria bacterium]|nr:MAG: HAD family hydrolase [Acidobacteriota bacterium]
MTATQNQAIPLNGFRWMEGDAYLFDIDGTLLVTRDLVHRNALHHAMREVYGVDTTIDGIAYHGKTDLGILRAALERMGISGEVFDAKLPDALNVVCLDVAAHPNRIVANVCDWIPEVLARLKAAGKLLGVASGNLEAVGWHKIKAAGLREFFSFGCFSDHCEMRVDIFRQGVDEARRRLGENAVACFIGDTPEDIRAARGVGAQVVAVCTGIFKNDELACHAPDACISSCMELLAG